MMENSAIPAPDATSTEKRAWETPSMEVFDVATVTANGPFGNPFNPTDVTLYQS